MATAPNLMFRQVMDVRQAADYLGITGDTLYRYASEGFVPAFKLGNRWRFKKDVLDAWMDQMSGVSPAKPVPTSNTADLDSIREGTRKPVRKAR